MTQPTERGQRNPQRYVYNAEGVILGFSLRALKAQTKAAARAPPLRDRPRERSHRGISRRRFAEILESCRFGPARDDDAASHAASRCCGSLFGPALPVRIVRLVRAHV